MTLRLLVRCYRHWNGDARCWPCCHWKP